MEYRTYRSSDEVEGYKIKLENDNENKEGCKE